MTATHRFDLVKWYADCTTAAGDALILYSAELRWRGPPIRYTSLLTHRDGGPAKTRFSLRKEPAPVVSEGSVGWRSAAWRAEGQWREAGPELHELLFDSPGGRLEWSCIAPRATAHARVGDTAPLRGWGYVERLRLTVPPWRLPIRRLRWGRFINETDSLVWIDWSGPYTRRVVYDNGEAATARTIGDRELVLGDGRTTLGLDPVAVLRDGALGTTALSVLPDLHRIFPSALLDVRECKWLSRATLRRPGRPDSIGMAIHEVVEWP
ncbi:MAG: hypothetical protein ACHQQ3_09310 [Gemmatimonadales bacterium]